MLKEKKEAVSPVIAVILMVAITVVLAAVLFVMVRQYTEDQPGGLETLSGHVVETTAGWRVEIDGGSIEYTSSVTIYVKDAATGSIVAGYTNADVGPGENITHNDLQNTGYINGGDNFVIDDDTHALLGDVFVIALTDQAFEFTLQG